MKTSRHDEIAFGQRSIVLVFARHIAPALYSRAQFRFGFIEYLFFIIILV